MRKALIVTLLMVAALLAVPLSSASVIHATINTKTNEGYVNATSNYVLYYTYPSNSSTSTQLNGTVMWMNATSYLNSSGRTLLGGDMGEYEDQQMQSDQSHFGMDANDANDSNVTGNSSTNSTTNVSSNNTANVSMPQLHVVNATLKYQLHVFATSTNLTVFRNLTLELKISNITKKVGNNSTIIDMSWRAFGVQGQLMSSFRGKLELVDPSLGLNVQSDVNTNMDVNMLGDIGQFGSFGGSGQGNGNFNLGDYFSGDGFGAHVMNYDTINFNVFRVPLQQWVRVYDSSTNSTTFFYNSTSNYSLNSSVTQNGQNYTLKLRTDPSAAITTNGNAKPTSSNELVVSNAAAPSTLTTGMSSIIAVAIVAVIAIGLAAVVMRQRTRKK
jgi:hypothetical protein